MIFYFSGTGNSYWTAKQLGNLINEQVESIVHYRNSPLICNDEVIGFVCPLYMWNLPAVVREVLEKASLGKDSYIFLALTSNHGDKKNMGDKCPVYKSMEELVEKAGGKLSSTFMLQMPGNALESTSEENEERLAAAPDMVKKFAEDIHNRVCNYAPKSSMMYSLFAGRKKDNGRSFTPTFTILDRCNGCGICSQVCPLDNIRMADGKPVHGTDCTSCFACMHWCPKQAAVVKRIQRKLQYTHPEVTLKDMVEAKADK